MFSRGVMNLSFLSKIGLGSSCTCWLYRFEYRSGLLIWHNFFLRCHDIDIEANCVLISFVIE